MHAARTTSARVLLALALLASCTQVSADPRDGAGFLVRGRLMVRDSTEVLRHVAFTLWSEDDRSVTIPAESRDGRFEFRARHAGRYGVHDLRIDGEPYRSSVRPVDVAPGRDVEIVVEPAAEPVLEVTDEVTGKPLRGARVYVTDIVDVDRSDLPAKTLVVESASDSLPDEETLAKAPLLTGESGKVVLPRVRGATHVFVVADHHAWRLHRIPSAPSGPVPVALAPGGALTLKVARWSELLQPRVTLRLPSGDEPSLPYPAADGTVHVEGLVAGPYVVTVHRGGLSSKTSYGMANVEIVAGRDTAASVDPARIDAGRTASFRGTLTVPVAWEADRVVLAFDGAEEGTEGLEARVTFEKVAPGAPMRFDPTVPLACGRYRATVDPMGFEQPIELRPDGGAVDLTLPEPAELRLRIVDDATGQEVPDASVWCQFAPTRGRLALVGRAAPFDPAKRTFHVLALPGSEVDVMPRAEEYFPWSETIRVPARGVAERTIRLRKMGVVVVRLEFAGQPYVNREKVRVVLVPSPDPFLRPPIHGRVEDGHAWIEGFVPGRYRMALDRVPADAGVPEGFAPVPHRDVEVTAGKVTEVVVVLQRAK